MLKPAGIKELLKFSSPYRFRKPVCGENMWNAELLPSEPGLPRGKLF